LILDVECQPDDWWRFIDDCLFWWSGTPGELLIFLNFVNSIHPDIKFTCEYNFQTRSVVFLDLVIWVDDQGYIQTDLHTKVNSKNNYLLPKSNHPSHICKNIPYSLAYRVKRNCSKPDLFDLRLSELKEMLLQRDYRPKVIDNAFDKVREIGREETLEKVSRENKNEGRVRALFMFDMRLPNLSGIFRKNWQTMVSEDIRLQSVFPQPPMVCYSREKNIREQLCQAKLPPARARLREVEDGFKRCGKSSCRLCPFTGLRPGQVQQSIMVSSTGEELPIKGRLTCKSANLLYMVTCEKGAPTCPDRQQYVGETGQTGEERFAEHRNTVVQVCHQGTTKPVGSHFQGPGHSVSDMRFTPIEQIYSNNIFVRKTRERRLINTLDLIRKGLNKKL
jgi:hypothetical protein